MEARPPHSRAPSKALRPSVSAAPPAMRLFPFILTWLLAVVAISAADAAANKALDERALPPQACSALQGVISRLRLLQATPFCSTFLGISTVTKTATSTKSTLTVVTSHALRTLVTSAFRSSTAIRSTDVVVSSTAVQVSVFTAVSTQSVHLPAFACFLAYP